MKTRMSLLNQKLSGPASHEFYGPDAHVTPTGTRKAGEEGASLNSSLVLPCVMMKVCGILIHEIFIASF